MSPLPALQLGKVNAESDETLTGVDAKTFEKPLVMDEVWKFGMWEKNPQPFPVFSRQGFVMGDTEFKKAAIDFSAQLTDFFFPYYKFLDHEKNIIKKWARESEEHQKIKGKIEEIED